MQHAPNSVLVGYLRRTGELLAATPKPKPNTHPAVPGRARAPPGRPPGGARPRLPTRLLGAGKEAPPPPRAPRPPRPRRGDPRHPPDDREEAGRAWPAGRGLGLPPPRQTGPLLGVAGG